MIYGVDHYRIPKIAKFNKIDTKLILLFMLVTKSNDVKYL